MLVLSRAATVLLLECTGAYLTDQVNECVRRDCNQVMVFAVDDLNLMGQPLCQGLASKADWLETDFVARRG